MDVSSEPPTDPSNVVPLFGDKNTPPNRFYINTDNQDYALFDLDCSFEELLDLLFDTGANITTFLLKDQEEDDAQLEIANDNEPDSKH